MAHVKWPARCAAVYSLALNEIGSTPCRRRHATKDGKGSLGVPRFRLLGMSTRLQRVAALSRQALDRAFSNGNTEAITKDYIENGIAEIEAFLAEKATDESLALV